VNGFLDYRLDLYLKYYGNYFERLSFLKKLMVMSRLEKRILCDPYDFKSLNVAYSTKNALKYL